MLFGMKRKFSRLESCKRGYRFSIWTLLQAFKPEVLTEPKRKKNMKAASYSGAPCKGGGSFSNGGLRLCAFFFD